MQRSLVLFILILLGRGLTLLAQPSAAFHFGGEEEDLAMRVVPMLDGGYLLAGNSRSFGAGESDVWILRLDDEGRELWRKYLGSPGLDWMHDLIYTRNGDFLLCGYVRDPGARDKDGWVALVDSRGETRWKRRFGGTRPEELHALVEMPKGGFAVAGYTRSFGKGGSDFWLLRLDADGEELWQQAYGTSGVERAQALTLNADGGLIIGGFQYVNERQKADMLLLKVDDQGIGQWRCISQLAGNDAVEALTVLPNGNILAAGWARGENDVDASLLLVSPKGSIKDQMRYGGNGRQAFYDILQLSDGAIAVAGETSGSNGDQDFWMLRLNDRGRVRGELIYDHFRADAAYGIAEDQKGNLLLAGKSGQNSGDFLLLRKSAQGSLPAPEKEPPPVADANLSEPTPDADEAAGLPNLYILSIGISNYQQNYLKLNFAHEDALAISEAFEYSKRDVFGQVSSRVLVDDAARLDAIQEGVQWISNQARPQDVALVFFSAHGTLDSRGDLYLLPYDYDGDNLVASALNLGGLFSEIGNLSNRTLVLLDACHAGQSGGDLLEASNLRSLSLNGNLETLAQGGDRISLLSASRSTEKAFEDPAWGHGAFTKALLEGLDGDADYDQNRKIELAEISLFVTQRVRDLTSGLQNPFMPINLLGNLTLMSLD